MKTKIVIPFLIIIASALLFFLSWQINSSSIDYFISNYFQNIQNNLGIQTMSWISWLGGFWFLGFVFLIVLFILYRKKAKRNILFYSLILIGVFIGKFLKEIFQIPRPVNLIETGFGFPSSHAIGSVLIYGAISYLLYKKGKRISSILIWILPLLICFSRLYLNVHWFSDVLGGIAFGIFWLCLIIFFYFKKK